MPELHAIAVLVVTVAVFYLYTRPLIRMELVSLLLLLALVIIFHAFPFTREETRLTETEVLQAFGHPALVAICSLMILGRGLTMTGALEPAVRLLARVWKFNRSIGLLLTLTLAAAASGFINDTPVLVLMLPMLLSLAERTNYPASKSLMPVNFAILAGGMLTSIGTSTNLLVLSIATDLGMPAMGLLDFTPIAALSIAVALPYLWLIAPRLLPDTSRKQDDSVRLFEARITIDPDDDSLLGKSLAELSDTLGRPMPIIALLRAGERTDADQLGTTAAGDVLFLRDAPSGLREVAQVFRKDLYDRDGEGRFVESDSSRVDLHLAEVVIGGNSNLIGHTLKDARFAESFRVVVVGLHCSVESLVRDSRDIGDTPLAVGDVLLVQGPADVISELRVVPGLLLVDSNLMLPRSPKAPWALGIMAAVVIAAASKWVPIHVAAFIGVIAMLLTGCVRLDMLGRALSLQVVLIVASSVALGQSLVSTGAADWIAQGVTVIVQMVPPAVQIGIFMAFAAVLTNFVSNSAAAAVGTPIAVATATQLGSAIEPFVLAVLFGANLSYATPMAYQTNLLVMNAAGYRFTDFLRAGVPLVLLMLLTLSVLLARHYGL